MALEFNQKQALDLWRQVMIQTVKGDRPDLTTRQLAVLMTVYQLPPPHTVRGLAAQLGVGKPAITRALDTLARHGLVKRRRDEEDGRNVLIQRTLKGQIFLDEFGATITSRAQSLAR